MTPNLITAVPGLLILIIAALQWIMPRLTRGDVWFAVTVSPAFPTTPEARRTEARYRTAILLAAGTALLPGVALARADALIFGVALQLVIGTGAFLFARQRTLPHAVQFSPVREAALQRSPTRLPATLQAGPFLIVVAAVIWLATRWSTLPSRLPVHWSLEGTVDRWVDKSVLAVFGPALSGATVCLVLWLLGGTIGRGRRVAAQGPAAEAEAVFRRRMMGLILASEYLVAITFALVAIPIAGGPVWPVMAAPFVSVAFIAAMFGVLVRTGQGGSRLAPATGQGDRTPDSRWKWGMFYVNSEDPALFVEKRFGIGYTINFARPAAWGLIALIVLLPAGLRLLVSAIRN